MTDLEYYDHETISNVNGDEIVLIIKNNHTQVVIREKLLGMSEAFTTFKVNTTSCSKVKRLLKSAPKVTGLAYHSDHDFCKFIAATYSGFAVHTLDKWQASEFMNSQIIIT